MALSLIFRQYFDIFEFDFKLNAQKIYMYQTKMHFIKPEMNLSDLFFENPNLLLMMEHLSLNYVFNDKSVQELCKNHNININLFITFANLYNGFYNINTSNFNENDIAIIIKFLRNSHHYYKSEKYPEVKSLIEQLTKLNDSKEVKLIERFFDEYFEEVIEHFNYEDKTAFPYFISLANKDIISIDNFSVKVYKDHHTDIEFKLMELKSLLLRHIPLKNDNSIRRKLLKVLFEIDYDLSIHSKIEDEILIPLVREIELKVNL